MGNVVFFLIRPGIIDLGAFCVELWPKQVSYRISVPMSYISCSRLIVSIFHKSHWFVCFCLFLFVFVRFSLFTIVSFIYVSFRSILSVFVHFCLFWFISVHFCLVLFIFVRFCSFSFVFLCFFYKNKGDHS